MTAALATAAADTPALETEGLSRSFGGGRSLLGRRRPEVQAVADVSLRVSRGETLGLVGESGCGKSTLARMLAGLLVPSAGRIRLEGRDLGARAGRDPAAFGRLIQYVFQDPISALNPRKTIREILETPLRRLHGLGRDARGARLDAILASVNLRPEFLSRYPHEFSGGQAQRIGIARALAAEARILVLDEPVSALDVSVQAQVINLLDDLRARLGLTYLFISHDLAVVEAVADRVAVMYLGRIVEIGPAEAVLNRPRHPYTRLLAASAPAVGRPLGNLEDRGELPNPLDPPTGCAFASRCPRVRNKCEAQRPDLLSAQGHAVACHHSH
jgi:oligopeptide/dipeptide ABC transporter ATP-binding protein